MAEANETAEDWFGDRLRELREERKLSRQELADLAGMKDGGVRDLEQGVNKPRWGSVIALAAALEVDVAEFLKPPTKRFPRQPGRPRKKKGG
jgi:transcriptional regulator with XRE-family HTH domain